MTFLTADLSVSVASVSIDGTVNLGTFGWCLNGVGTKAVCQGPQLGYELNSDQVFGNNTSFSLPNSLIKWLTYALIIHPIAAGLAAVAFLSGCISHCREFSRSRATTWIASLATTVALIAFVFDIVLFSIAKSRINSASNSDVGLKARLGNAVWLTLVGFILLLVSGCFFGFGHCCIKRRPTQAEKDKVRPQMDSAYASAARKDAEDLEKMEQMRRGGSSGLPAFPEEEMPLTAAPKTEELYAEEVPASEDIAGVGTGYGRGPGQQNAYTSPSRQRALPLPPVEQYPNVSDTGNVYNRAEPFTSMYDAPSRQNSPAYGHLSRTRQTSDPSPALYAGPQVPRRQGSATTSEGMPIDQYRPNDPAAFPVPGQYGGRNPLAFASEDFAHRDGDEYPPRNLSDQAHHGQGYTLYPPGAAYLAPTTLPPTTQDSFHSRAAASRHRQSRSMGADVYRQEQYQQPVTNQAWPHQPELTQSNGHLEAPAATSRYREYEGGDQPVSFPAASSSVSPTTEVYESYYTPSPSNNAPPPLAIPYVADPEATPSPSYHSAEPYPTYGGNVYR